MAKKRSTKKKTTKKKAAKKKAKKPSSAPAKKKASKKKAAKKPAPRRNLPAVKADQAPPPADIEIQVWAAYRRLRSRAKVAAELELTEHRVRTILDSDGGRLRAMIDSYREFIVADKEELERGAMNLLHRLMQRYDAMLLEIERAAAEAAAAELPTATAITTIKNADGVPLPVPDAIELLVCSRGFSQLVAMVSSLQKDISVYRDRQAGEAPADGDGPENFGDMHPAELADMLDEAGFTMPGVLQRLRVVNEKPAGPGDRRAAS